MSITEFLLARIEDDERRAADWRATLDGNVPIPASILGGLVNPDRVLAECTARRTIIDAVSGWNHAVVDDCWYTCGAATEERDGGECCNDAVRGGGCDCGKDYRVGQVLRPLAAVYADHPDFDPAWRTTSHEPPTTTTTNS